MNLFIPTWILIIGSGILLGYFLAKSVKDAGGFFPDLEGALFRIFAFFTPIIIALLILFFNR